MRLNFIINIKVDIPNPSLESDPDANPGPNPDRDHNPSTTSNPEPTPRLLCVPPKEYTILCVWQFCWLDEHNWCVLVPRSIWCIVHSYVHSQRGHVPSIRALALVLGNDKFNMYQHVSACSAELSAQAVLFQWKK